MRVFHLSFVRYLLPLLIIISGLCAVRMGHADDSNDTICPIAFARTDAPGFEEVFPDIKGYKMQMNGQTIGAALVNADCTISSVIFYNTAQGRTVTISSDEKGFPGTISISTLKIPFASLEEKTTIVDVDLDGVADYYFDHEKGTRFRREKDTWVPIGQATQPASIMGTAYKWLCRHITEQVAE